VENPFSLILDLLAKLALRSVGHSVDAFELWLLVVPWVVRLMAVSDVTDGCVRPLVLIGGNC